MGGVGRGAGGEGRGGARGNTRVDGRMIGAGGCVCARVEKRERPWLLRDRDSWFLVWRARGQGVCVELGAVFGEVFFSLRRPMVKRGGGRGAATQGNGGERERGWELYNNTEKIERRRVVVAKEVGAVLLALAGRRGVGRERRPRRAGEGCGGGGGAIAAAPPPPPPAPKSNAASDTGVPLTTWPARAARRRRCWGRRRRLQGRCPRRRRPAALEVRARARSLHSRRRCCPRCRSSRQRRAACGRCSTLLFYLWCVLGVIGWVVMCVCVVSVRKSRCEFWAAAAMARGRAAAARCSRSSCAHAHTTQLLDFFLPENSSTSSTSAAHLTLWFCVCFGLVFLGA
jgi:hypothetical protein